jgi:hypothetical protein
LELAKPVKQVIHAPLRRRRTCPQDPKDGTILIISFLKFCVTNLFIILNSVLQKAGTGVDPHYLDLWKPAHQSNANATEKLVSISLYSYALFVTFVLNSIFHKTDIRRS